MGPGRDESFRQRVQTGRRNYSGDKRACRDELWRLRIEGTSKVIEELIHDAERRRRWTPTVVVMAWWAEVKTHPRVRRRSQILKQFLHYAHSGRRGTPPRAELLGVRVGAAADLAEFFVLTIGQARILIIQSIVSMAVVGPTEAHPDKAILMVTAAEAHPGLMRPGMPHTGQAVVVFCVARRA